MPTFNQLVKQGRKSVAKKSNSPALQSSYNSLKKKSVDTVLHRSVVFVLCVRYCYLRRSLTQHFVRLPEFVFPTASR